MEENDKLDRCMRCGDRLRANADMVEPRRDNNGAEPASIGGETGSIFGKGNLGVDVPDAAYGRFRAKSWRSSIICLNEGGLPSKSPIVEEDEPGTRVVDVEGLP